jgi:putative transposase
VVLVENGVSIPKVGVVQVKQHRPLCGEIKSATIKQEPTGRWKITFVSHIEIPDVQPTSAESPIGLDVGLSTFLTTLAGEKTAPPQCYRKQEKQVKRAHKNVSRKKKGSRNRSRAMKRLACVYARVRQKRQDFLHQLTHRLLSEHDVICIEDLNLSALAKTKLRGHSKSWLDASFGEFRRMLAYKSVWNGKRLVAIDRWFASSKTCHLCQHKTELAISDRTWTCSNPECGAVHDRDVNAAINILLEGLRMLSEPISVGTTECKKSVEESVRLLKRSSSSVKQKTLSAS